MVFAEKGYQRDKSSLYKGTDVLYMRSCYFEVGKGASCGTGRKKMYIKAILVAFSSQALYQLVQHAKSSPVIISI